MTHPENINEALSSATSGLHSKIAYRGNSVRGRGNSWVEQHGLFFTKDDLVAATAMAKLKVKETSSVDIAL